MSARKAVIDPITVPPGFDRWNPAMRGAYLKGKVVGASGGSIDSCPYEDHRKDCGRLTWSRSFIRSWQDGWRVGAASRLFKAGEDQT